MRVRKPATCVIEADSSPDAEPSLSATLTTRVLLAQLAVTFFGGLLIVLVIAWIVAGVAPSQIRFLSPQYVWTLRLGNGIMSAVQDTEVDCGSLESYVIEPSHPAVDGAGRAAHIRLAWSTALVSVVSLAAMTLALRLQRLSVPFGQRGRLWTRFLLAFMACGLAAVALGIWVASLLGCEILIQNGACHAGVILSSGRCIVDAYTWPTILPAPSPTAPVMGYGPRQLFRIDLPSWTACAVAGPLILLAFLLRPRIRRRVGHCGRCGYNLAGNVSGRCPECGQAVKAEGEPT
jgi:hypothetical protein